MLTVDIDTGGTMTDALVSDGETRHAFKVDTTQHDYTVSFLACLREAARHFGDDSVAAFLGRVGLIRWSSTITTTRAQCCATRSRTPVTRWRRPPTVNKRSTGWFRVESRTSA